MFRFARIIVLLLILATVAQTAWLAQSRAAAWTDTLYVGIYPMAADATGQARTYVDRLAVRTFAPIEDFFDEEAARYSIGLARPVSVALAPALQSLPPLPPRNANILQSILWSLQMRWWAWRHDAIDGPQPAVRLFVLFHDPATTPHVAHSVGLSRGMLGIIHVYATPAAAGSNNVVITHELLHTLGATDKYDPATNLPQHPDGYAEPERQPRYPQAFAEIMGGRIPLTPDVAEIPASLDRVLVGPATAREIGWMRE